jgi:hypothetical protein
LEGRQVAKKREIQIVDTEGLSDGDWVQINKLTRAYDKGGSKAFWQAMEKLIPFSKLSSQQHFFPNLSVRPLKMKWPNRE